MLRFLTAGESHGPALVVTVEGLPAGLPILIDDVADELARRRLGYGRGPRMRFETGRARVPRRRPPRPHARVSPSRSSSATASGRPASGPRRCRRRPGAPRRRSPSPGPVTPISRACRSTASTDARDVLERASRARDRGAGRGRRGRQGAARAPRRLGAESRRAARRRDASPIAHRPTPDDLEQIDTLRGAVLRSRRRSRDDPRDQGGGEGRRLARRRRRGARLRRAARARLARALGPPHRRSARAGADEHPGDEGGRDRRGLHGRGRARQRGARRDRWDAEARRVPARVGARGRHRRRHDDRRPPRRRASR